MTEKDSEIGRKKGIEREIEKECERENIKK